MADVINRDELEAKLGRVVSRELREQLKELIKLLGDPPNPNNVPLAFWDESTGKLQAVIEPILRDVYLQQAGNQLDQSSIGVEWSAINQSAVEWSSRYSFGLVSGITDRSRNVLRASLEGYFRNPTTIGDLENSLLSAFGARRAEMIAITEVTRAASAGEQEVIDRLLQNNPGIQSIDIWQTSNDDRVCIICGPLNNKERGDGWDENPPIHPRCRCWLRHDFKRKKNG